MIASLPMYDRPEMHAVNDRFWTAVADELRARGIAAPDSLTRSGDPWADWAHPALVLSQTCGMPFRKRLAGKVTLVATPVYDIADVPPGHYHSVIVCRRDDPRRTIRDFRDATMACNDKLSQSGWTAPQLHLSSAGVRPRRVVQTGAHAASAAAVAEGHADLAGIDVLTWRMIERFDPLVRDLRVIDRTPDTPALPFITAAGRDPGPVRSALSAALAGLSGKDRARLGYTAITVIPKADYLAMEDAPTT